MALVLNGSGITSANIADGTITTDDINSSDVSSLKSGRKNLIINGGMNVAQRGTSTTGVGTTGFFACDRVKFYAGAGGGSSSSRYTVTQSTDAPSGFANSFKIDCTTANASPSAAHNTFLRFGLIENQDLIRTKFGTSSAESLTLSFWVKSNITGSQQALIVSHTNQKQAGDTFTIDSADTWEKKTITVPGDTVNSFANNSSQAITVDMFLEAGSNYYGGTAQGTTWGARTDNTKAVNRLNISSSTSNYINFTGVQLELGSTATDFEHRSYGEELALCQRYYFDYGYAAGADTVRFNPGAATVASAKFQMNLQFPVGMRAAPTVTVSANGRADGVLTTLNSNGNGRLPSSWAGAADITANYCTIFCVDDDDTVKTGFRGYFKADAEL